MINSVIAVDILALFVTLIVLYGTIFESRTHVNTDKKHAFALLSLTVLISLICDLGTWIIEGRTGLIWLNRIMTDITFMMGFVSPCFFSWFVYEHLASRSKISPRSFSRIVKISLVFLALTLIACWTGMFYTLREGVYDSGPLYIAYVLMIFFIFAAQMVLVIRHRRSMSRHDYVSILIHILLPTLAMSLNVLLPDYSLAYPISSLSLLLMYVMLQAEKETEHIHREAAISTEARQDELTGLLNRRAYIERLHMLTSADELGVIFCDANGLKYANDHQGHQAGDQLLCGLAELLAGIFGHNVCFRISGDEFVVLLPNLSRELFDERVNVLRRHMDAQKVPPASVGSAFGTQHEALLLLAAAEKSMYADKQRFYLRFPTYKRA